MSLFAVGTFNHELSPLHQLQTLLSIETVDKLCKRFLTSSGTGLVTARQLTLTYEDGGLVPARGHLERRDVAALQGPARPVAGHQGAGARHAAEEPADGGVGLVAPPAHTRPQAAAPAARGLASVAFRFIIVFPAASVSIRFFVLSVSRLSF